MRERSSCVVEAVGRERENLAMRMAPPLYFPGHLRPAFRWLFS